MRIALEQGPDADLERDTSMNQEGIWRSGSHVYTDGHLIFAPGWSAPEPVTVQDGAAPVQVLRPAYCPEPRPDCAWVAGNFADPYVDFLTDPNAPPSGWDYHVTPLRVGRAASEGTRLTTLCGVELWASGLQHSGCREPYPQVLRCLAGLAAEAWEEGAGDDEIAEADPLRHVHLYVRGNGSQVELSLLDVTEPVCLNDNFLVVSRARDYASARSLDVLSLRAPHHTSSATIRDIFGARTLSIADHSEQESECANAWDGLALVPIMHNGNIVGSLVVGGSPVYFSLRGDVNSGVRVDESLVELALDALPPYAMRRGERFVAPTTAEPASMR